MTKYSWLDALKKADLPLVVVGLDDDDDDDVGPLDLELSETGMRWARLGPMSVETSQPSMGYMTP